MKYDFSDCELDTARREIRRAGVVVAVEPKVFDLLLFMMKNQDRVLTKDELVENVWEGRFISDSAVSSAVKFARKAVGDNGKDQHTIKTVFGLGFRFIRPVSTVSEAQSPATPPQTQTKELTNIPSTLASLEGRTAELAKLRSLIDEKHLISIVGPGGAGKSALAQNVGQLALSSFPGGVWFCELASVDAAQVQSAVLGSMDHSAGAGPVDAARIAERLGDAPSLLILDNCEHVLDAVIDLADDLLTQSTPVTILTTSREPLDVLGEQLFRISGLDCASDDAAAVQLFHKRASEIVELPQSPENSAVLRQITERLEGLPLAIELAAPRLAYNTPSELLAMLDDQIGALTSRRRRSSARHSTMDDAIAWSFDLLDTNQREILLTLSVFAGKFTMDAAIAICGHAGAAETVHRLVQQSVVSFVPSRATSRFKLLEPIRQFAQRQLTEEKSAKIAQKHAEWSAERATRLAAALRGPGEIDACDALTIEWADLGRALTWGRINARSDIAINPLLAMHIHMLWQLRIEGFSWLEAGIETCEISKDQLPRVKLMQSMGRWSAGDLVGSETLLSESVSAGGETTETMYFRFYQAFAQEDFEGVFEAAEAAWRLAKKGDDLAWETTTVAFRIIGRTMRDPSDPIIVDLLSDLDRRLDMFDWPSGHCASLLAKLTSAFMQGDAISGDKYRRELDAVANRCNAPWFKITASGVGAQQQGSASDGITKVKRSAENMRTAVASGDVMQLPTLVRFAAMELWEIGNVDAAAKLVGFVPKVRGLGEKGTMAPGYDETVKLIREALPIERLKDLLFAGSQLTLDEAAKILETAAIADTCE